MKSPLVSVVIPAYNAAPFIEEAMQSVLNQIYQNIELVVVNDGSTDNTEDIVKKIASGDSRVIYTKQENAGQAAARKKGVSMSKGEWLSLLDADNILLPNACARVMGDIEAAGENACDVYYGDLRYFQTDKPEELYKYSYHYVKQIDLETLIGGNPINFLGSFIRRKFLLDSIDVKYRRAEDHAVWLKLILKEAKFCFVDEVIGKLRFHGTNLSFDESYLIETAVAYLEIFDWLEAEIRIKYSGEEKEKYLRDLERSRTEWMKRAYIGGLINRDRKSALDYLKKWHKRTGNFIYYPLLALSRITPIGLTSKILAPARKRRVMNKYSRA